MPCLISREKNICEFIWKLKDMIERHSEQIDWTQDGKDIIVKSSSLLQTKTLPNYFRHSNFHSFIRQLNMYGFCKKSKEGQTIVFSHEVFWKENGENFYQIKRKSKPKAEKTISNKLEKENSQLLSQLETSKSISEAVKNSMVGLLEYKERVNQNTKKIKKMLDKLCNELKDTRLKQVIENVDKIKVFIKGELESQIKESQEIQRFIDTFVDGQTPKNIIPPETNQNNKVILLKKLQNIPSFASYKSFSSFSGRDQGEISLIDPELSLQENNASLIGLLKNENFDFN